MPRPDGAFEIFVGKRIGHIAGVVTGAFVGDTDVEALALYAEQNVHLFAIVHLIAMLDGIDDGFEPSELIPKIFLFVFIILFFQLIFDSIPEPSALR